MAGGVFAFGRPNDRFTIIANDFIRDGRIKPSAFRVACYVLSHMEGYQLTQKGIARCLEMNETTVRAALKHLEELGYLVRRESRNERGYRGPDNLYLSQEVFPDDVREHIQRGFDQDAESQPGEIHAGESPAPKKTNSTQKTKTQEHEESSSSTDDGLFEPPAEAPKPKSAKALEAEFEAWWAHYPRKVGKGSALRAFKSARKTASVQELHDGLGAAIQAWDAARTEIGYKPHPATWLNRKGWLDDPAAVGGSGQASPARRSMPGPGVVHTREEIEAQREWLAQQPAATPISAEELAEFWGEELGEVRD